ncbi:hypothetical protein PCAR4_200040 [Paraburkholderia caribensis]|nr:hypothetical protein PCAR4_200040 [Paraburkholderia caribensis]
MLPTRGLTEATKIGGGRETRVRGSDPGVPSLARNRRISGATVIAAAVAVLCNVDTWTTIRHRLDVSERPDCLVHDEWKEPPGPTFG